ncbi:hypothetical protein DH2020_040702 [Rehmannia glutinosa]|uniref:Uncharacterized protein n=1 Tax=Rehmannia glutinosa TaxID=99300 RepID=A0ABR0USV4_REHGL
MASSSGQTLSGILQEIIKWRSNPDLMHDEYEIPWTGSHISVVLDYVLKFESINPSHFRARSYTDAYWYAHFEGYNYKVSAKMVLSFTQDLRELFEIPKLQHLCDNDYTLKKNELLAAFINFLLQLLCHRTSSSNTFEDRVDSLQLELGFLFTILWDKSFLDVKLEQVQNLLAEFEAVVNDAGSLVHSFIFVSSRIFKSIGIDKALDALFKRVDLLKVNTIKFSNLLPFISNDVMTPKNVSVVSLFIVDSLVYDLEDLMNREDGLIVNVKDQIKVLHHGLLLSQSLLKGIKVPPDSDIKELKETKSRITDVAYEVEYLISSFLAGNAPLWYLTVRLTDVIHKIRLVGTALQEIQKNYDSGALKVAEEFSVAQISSETKIISEVDNTIVGFEDRATDILDQLVGGTEQLQIISIFGMPGIGKTTFAKKLYNHPLVNYRFDKLLWCVISQTYQRKNILIEILISSTSDLDKVEILNMEEESLAEHIYKRLKGRRYLLVMDDIWDSNVWDDFRRCFPDDGNGSRILFTSRNKDVAQPNNIIYALPSLSNDQCWELLKKKVFRDKPCPSELLLIGKEIAASCYGLPLAVVVIAGILSTVDKDENTWENVGQRLASYIISDQNNSTMQILELSYKHLPDYLKPCFLYFGEFPEDTTIPVRNLMRLWIAEGFIHKEHKKCSECVAEEYLMELIDKSLVIVAERRSDGGVKACVIHDLLHDLCLKRSEEENFLQSVKINNAIYVKGHRTESLQNSITTFRQYVPAYHGGFLGFPFYVRSMKLLRVLDFNSMIISARLVGIEFMVQLRYLVINDLSASIGSLVNLEYLHVDSTVGAVTKIPCIILKMLKLRYIHVTPRAIYAEDCSSSQTNNLQSLSCIDVSNLKDEEMLKCSPHLRKLKCLCQPLLDKQGAYRYPDLRLLTQLESLKMTIFYGHEMADISLP